MRRFALFLCACIPMLAHDIITTKVTFDREISRLLFDRCTSCHRDGGAAFSLATYDAARPWAKAIKEEVLERRMPPFGAVKGFADLRDDRSLTQEQLEIISDWVEGERRKEMRRCFRRTPISIQRIRAKSRSARS